MSLDRIFQFSCDYCELVVEKVTNKFPSGWKWSQIMLHPVKHICGGCRAVGHDPSRNWKDGGGL